MTPLRGNGAAFAKRSDKMERRVTVGSAVVFVDTSRRPHTALVTEVFGDEYGRLSLLNEETGLYEQRIHDLGPHWPAINLVYVSDNPDQDDKYGRQIERDCSVVYVTDNSASANCWRFLDE